MTHDPHNTLAQDSLKGKCILVTRPQQQSGPLVAELKLHGAIVEELPLIRICPPDSFAPLDRALSNLDLYAWLVFASANAVETTLERARQIGASDKLKAKSIACIGPATAACLLPYGMQAALTPKNAIAESLVQEFPQAPPASASSRRILWPKTNIGRTLIKDALEKLGWQVDIVHSYKTAGPENPQASAARLQFLLQTEKLTVITLTSSETARKLQELLLIATGKDSSLAEALLAKTLLAAIGPETARTCRSIFGRVDIEPAEFTAKGLLEAIVYRCANRSPER